MHDELKADVTKALREKLAILSNDHSLSIIDTGDRARFYGDLMISALGTPVFAKPVEAGEMICLAVTIDGRPYGVGMRNNGESWVPVGKAFGLRNKPSEVADWLEGIWVKLVAELA